MGNARTGVREGGVRRQKWNAGEAPALQLRVHCDRESLELETRSKLAWARNVRSKARQEPV